jgi:hypothetical protein
MASLAEIRQRLKEAETRREGNGGSSNRDTTIYPFWNMNDGDEATVRFLPDADPNNAFFWAERQMINLPFAGIKGENESKPVNVQVPCVEMYNDGSVCPILAEVRPWWNDKSLEDMARKYWKKRNYILQGFVVQDGLKETDAPVNLIRKFTVTPQVYKLIQAILMDEELDELPTDYVLGLDFKIKKGTVGKWADYSQSTWSRKTRPLNVDELTAIDTHSLFNLKDSLPTKPTAEDLVLIKEMFEASVDGQLFDPVRWAKYRPYSPRNNDATPRAAAVQPVAQPQAIQQPVIMPEVEQVYTQPIPEPVVEQVAAAPVTNTKAQDILATIRNRGATA